MTASAAPGADTLYAMHRRWLSDVLGAGDSLFTPGSAVWAADRLDELERDFSGQPDLTKGKRFLDKLHDQLAHASPAAIQLMAELHVVHFLIVFGELLFLLEDRTESARTLYRPKKPFQVPANLWLIGTMNTADRSVAVIDAAMRRRFHFVPFFPHDGLMRNLLRRWLDHRSGRAGVADLLDAVNAELLELVGEHLLIGPSHFMKTDLSDRALARIWTYNVFPLIEEQLWGDRDAIARWRWDSVRERFAETLALKTTPDTAPGASDGGGDETACG
jgi:5-methylcytosine-specific restriction protein B